MQHALADHENLPSNLPSDANGFADQDSRASISDDLNHIDEPQQQLGQQLEAAAGVWE